jgi:SAM-dependent methyltransferase
MPWRDYTEEAVPAGGGVENFDREVTHRLNQARLEHLGSLGLTLDGLRVLDVGCGVGHLSRFFVERGCQVVSTDARAENIARLRKLYPGLEAHVVDVESDPLDRFGEFDVVLAYGLLYHLESPIRALRNLASVCKSLLLLETMVCDHHLPLLLLDDETKTVSQALGGLGHRPTPSYVVMALNRIGFHFVYGAAQVPSHEDFQFAWRDDLAWFRDGHPLRAMFAASREELQSPGLQLLLGPSGAARSSRLAADPVPAPPRRPSRAAPTA